MRASLAENNPWECQDVSGYSQLVRERKPNIYLLNGNDRTVTIFVRSIDVGRPRNIRNRKVIILTGATGCGRSSLINGTTINYILGESESNETIRNIQMRFRRRIRVPESKAQSD